MIYAGNAGTHDPCADHPNADSASPPPRTAPRAEIPFPLFGPRQTGKSTLIRQTLAPHRTYDLLDTETYARLSRTPHRLSEECAPGERFLIIDEIQKLPILLDEVHRLIETRGVHVLLTGSSARALRRGGVNLLGGRARVRALHPLSITELGPRFDLLRALNHGLLPPLYGSDAPEQDLASYVGTYLQLEIAAEGFTRNIPAFSRFIEIAALSNGRLANYTKMANDAQVARTTVQEYFRILTDTMVAHEVPAWRRSTTRKPLATSKYYLFDPGVLRVLQRRSPVALGSPEFGELCETYCVHELKTFLNYRAPCEIVPWRDCLDRLWRGDWTR